MSDSQLQGYLEAFEARLRRLIWLRGGALVIAVALLITLGGAWLAIRTGFAPRPLTAARLVLLAVLLLGGALLLARPLRRLKRERSRIIERLAHEFDGRLQTLADLPPGHAFHELLAEDALSIARRHAPATHVSTARLSLAGLALALPSLALLWLAAAGPGLYRDGTRALWAGWLFGSLLPAQRLAVQPGNQTVRLGGSVTVRTIAHGFDPARAQLHARVGAGPWQQIDMGREGQAFSFTFLSMREPVSYYVSAAGVRSPAYTLSVVAVPGLARLRLVYRYPDWTHLPEHVQEGSGDISAIAGTRVQIQMHASVALEQAELVLDDVASPMQTQGQDGQAQLQVSRDAHYYLATRIGTERVRLSDDFQIHLLPVPAPSVRFTWPGRDYSASSIEEVTSEVQASDAYGLQSLELRYSVNGGPWHAVPLPAGGVSAHGAHVFSLESLRTDGVARALAPGDLISYYAVARGHALVAQSDLYLIDVQPFDKRYSQSQSDDGSDVNEQQQISDRERQILLSTWNLLRGQGTASANSLHDDAALLATLQTRLAAQAQTLAGRTQARDLAQDAKIARFIDSMRHAAAAMQPAATRLAATQLSAAVAPEQQALQYLLQAQSQFTDVKLALQQHDEDKQQQSGRDLSQIYQLEMDLHKNQYESGSGASPQSADEQSEALARRLQELAQRQQQLAEQLQRTPVPSPDQRWQQQSLQREAEDLQRELAAQAQGGGSPGAALGSASGGAPENASGSASGSAGAAAGTSDSGSGAPGSNGTALGERLAAAIRAMGEAAGAGGATGTMHGDAPAAALRAQQALSEASSELARERAQQLQQSVSQLAQRAAELEQQQAASAQALQSVEGADGLGQRALADQKRGLSTAVRQLDDAIAAQARAHREDAPATAAALASAQGALHGANLANRLDIAAQALDAGAARAVLPGETRITQGLAEVQRQLQSAARIAGQGATPSGAGADPLAEELARLRTLRSQLQQQANAAQSAGTAPAGGATKPATARAKSASPTPAGATPAGATPADAKLAGTTSARVAAGAAGLLPLLRAQGANAHELATVQRLARTLGASPPLPAGRTPDVQRLRSEVDLLDALELQLEQGSVAGQPTRTAIEGRGAEQYQGAVAEYYRQLSRQ